MDNIASQAKFFNNLPLISPKYRSVVHLEDQEDKAFWDTLLQRFRPGKYFYVPYSKSNKGFDTHGCDQCLKYLPFLSSRFFVCIDSDLRNLMGEPDLDAAHYVVQTYTYSWESHCCEFNGLQTTVTANASGCSFDFSVFLSKLSIALYEPLLLLLYCKRTGNAYLTEKDFRHILRTQCTSTEVQNDGQGYVDCIANQFKPLIAGRNGIGFDVKEEATLYSVKGLTADNAYLHVRGHNIYDLVLYIGKRMTSSMRINFTEDVLKEVPLSGNYWEYTEIEKDLKSI